MSHIVEHAVDIQDMDVATDTMKELGLKEKNYGIRSAVKMWGRSQPADLVFFKPGHEYEVGIKKEPDGTKLIADSYAYSGRHTKILDPNEFKKKYTFNLAKKKLKQQGFQFRPLPGGDGIQAFRFVDGREEKVNVKYNKGSATVATEGFTGRRCYDATAGLEKALGTKIKDKPTAELHSNPNTGMKMKLDNSGHIG